MDTISTCSLFIVMGRLDWSCFRPSVMQHLALENYYQTKIEGNLQIRNEGNLQIRNEGNLQIRWLSKRHKYMGIH